MCRAKTEQCVLFKGVLFASLEFQSGCQHTSVCKDIKYHVHHGINIERKTQQDCVFVCYSVWYCTPLHVCKHGPSITQRVLSSCAIPILCVSAMDPLPEELSRWRHSHAVELVWKQTDRYHRLTVVRAMKNVGNEAGLHTVILVALDSPFAAGAGGDLLLLQLCCS